MSICLFLLFYLAPSLFRFGLFSFFRLFGGLFRVGLAAAFGGSSVVGHFQKKLLGTEKIVFLRLEAGVSSAKTGGRVNKQSNTARAILKII